MPQQIPECLKRKLVFGDKEQIEAIRQLEAESERKEEEKRMKASGEIKQYSVTIEYCGEMTKAIWATSEDDAREQADKYNFDDVDMDRTVFVRRVN